MEFRQTSEFGTEINILFPDQSATENFAIQLAGIAHQGDVIFLHGDLGVGKSVLARAFIRAYCQTDEDIPSPTFTLVQTYDMGLAPVFHFDLYRLESPNEVFELGIEEAFSDGISLIEWPSRLGAWSPVNRLEIHMIHGSYEKSRKTCIAGFGNWKARVEDQFWAETKHV